MSQHEHWMRHALKLAEQAQALGEVPVGAVVVLNDAIIGEGWNQPISGQDATAHAEILALREACQNLGNYRLPGASLYVTLEPCVMCAGAMIHARIDNLFYAAAEPKTGADLSRFGLFDLPCFNHHIHVRAGVLAAQSSDLLRAFFRSRR